jgi:hypothetical protein
VYLKSKDTSEMHSTSNGINDNMSVQTNGTISETRSTLQSLTGEATQFIGRRHHLRAISIYIRILHGNECSIVTIQACQSSKIYSAIQ